MPKYYLSTDIFQKSLAQMQLNGSTWSRKYSGKAWLSVRDQGVMSTPLFFERRIIRFQNSFCSETQISAKLFESSKKVTCFGKRNFPDGNGELNWPVLAFPWMTVAKAHSLNLWSFRHVEGINFLQTFLCDRNRPPYMPGKRPRGLIKRDICLSTIKTGR